MTTDVYELMLLSAMVRDVNIYNKTMGLVDTSMFTSPLSGELYELIHKFHQDQQRVPNQQELLHIYKRDRLVEDDSTLVKFVEAMYNQPINTDFIVQELHRYVRLRKMEHLFKRQYEQIKLGADVDTSTIVSDMFRIQMEAVQDRCIYGVSLDDAHTLLEQEQARKPIPTNVRYLNDILEGGLSGGQLGIILAPPNYGKTMTLLNFAIYAFLKGNNVLFVTMEMKEFSILRRVTMLMGGALKMNVDMNTIQMVSAELGKKFIILYKPSRSITVDYLYSVYHQAAADGIKFDCIYLDYADLLMSSNKYKEKRFELSDIFNGLKAYAQVLDVGVWSATQANREGLRSETITIQHMSEDFSKAAVSDVVLSLNDKIKANSNVKLFLTKHREGRSDLFIDTYVNEKLWFEETANLEIGLSKL
jgi:replicative DNA helicase